MISVLLFTVAFFVVLILFYYKTVSKDSVIALGCILATIITTLLVQDLTTKIPYYAIYSVPIILLIVSMILMTVAISNFNEFGRLPLSKKHEKDFKKYLFGISEAARHPRLHRPGGIDSERISAHTN